MSRMNNISNYSKTAIVSLATGYFVEKKHTCGLPY